MTTTASSPPDRRRSRGVRCCCAAAAASAALALAGLLGATTRVPATPAPRARPPGPWLWPAPARAKSVIFLFMEGGPSHIDTVRPQAAAQRAGRQAAPAELQAGDHADGRGRTRRCWPRSGSGSSTARAGSGSPTGCRTSPSCADDLAVIRSCWAERPEPRRRRLPDEHRLDPRRAARRWGAGSATAWGPRTRTCPAFVVLLDNAGAGRRRRPAELGRRVHAGRLPGDAAPAAAPSRSPTSAPPKGIDEDRAARQARLPRPAQPPPRRATRREQTELDARITSYELAFRMQAEAPEAVDLASEIGRDAGPLRHGREGDRDLRPQLPAGPPPGRARRPVRPALPRRRQPSGTPTPASRRTTPALCRAMDKPVAGLLDGPQAARACSTRRWSSGAASSAARRCPRRGTAATTTRTASPCGWPAAASRAAGPSARPTRSASTPSRTGSTSTTSTPRSSHLMGVDHTKLIYRHKGRPERPDPQRGCRVGIDHRHMILCRVGSQRHPPIGGSRGWWRCLPTLQDS